MSKSNSITLAGLELWFEAEIWPII